jgi:hypothetical protein
MLHFRQKYLASMILSRPTPVVFSDRARREGIVRISVPRPSRDGVVDAAWGVRRTNEPGSERGDRPVSFEPTTEVFPRSTDWDRTTVPDSGPGTWRRGGRGGRAANAVIGRGAMIAMGWRPSRALEISELAPASRSPPGRESTGQEPGSSGESPNPEFQDLIDLSPCDVEAYWKNNYSCSH